MKNNFDAIVIGTGQSGPFLAVRMAVLEALTGQIFLVVMVSRLVALFTPTQRATRRALRARAGSDASQATELDDDDTATDDDAGA